MIRYFLYILRWTVLAVPGALFFEKARQILGIENVYVAMIVSQALMGAMVFFIDKHIFSSGAVPVPWEAKPRAVCADCGRAGKCYRVAGEKCCEVCDKDAGHSYRCEACAVKKVQALGDQGIV